MKITGAAIADNGSLLVTFVEGDAGVRFVHLMLSDGGRLVGLIMDGELQDQANLVHDFVMAAAADSTPSPDAIN
jgi:hypothetical protein